VPEFAWVISHVSAELKIGISETLSIIIINPDDGDLSNTGF
jgi:hypothetical protein